MTARAELLIPDGWKVKPGVRVGIIRTKDNPSPPHGVWRVIDRAPEANTWWIQPVNDAAKAWAQHFPNAMLQGCLQSPAKALVPPLAAGHRTAGPE